MNILEILNDAVKPFLNKEKPPLNVGEAMNLWFYLTATEQSMAGEQVSFNTVQDPELKERLKDVLENVHKPIHEELTAFMKAEGVPMPAPSADKPVGDYRGVPEGAKLTDGEVANLVSFNIVLGINYATRGLTEAVRPDVAAMFARFQLRKAAFMIPFRDMLVRKGWLQEPPPYRTGALVQ